MPGDHAFLSPSASSRFLTCTPSVRLEEKYPESESEAAKEGTFAHDWAELMIKRHLGIINDAQYGTALDQLMIEDEKDCMDAAMEGHCEDYKNFVIAQFAAAKHITPDATLLIEEKLNLTAYMPESDGRLDIGIVADRIAYVTDFKYGKGVLVRAQKNYQLRLYALGFLERIAMLYQIEKVVITIYQPRMNNIESVTYTVEELRAWGTDFVIPRAILAFEGRGEFVVGDHCRFCKAKGECRKIAEVNLELANKAFEDPDTIGSNEVVQIIEQRDFFKKWIDAVYDTALHNAQKGTVYPGYKVVAGRSDRLIKDKKLVETRFIEAGFTHEQIFKPEELQGITALTKLAKPKKFDELTKDLLIKSVGKPALVPEADNRAAYNSTDTATKIFDDADEADKSKSDESFL